MFNFINSKQCKAARMLLDWTQSDLAKFSKVADTTIADFEVGKRDLRIGTLETIVKTFEKNNIVFENDKDGFGVKLTHSSKTEE